MRGNNKALKVALGLFLLLGLVAFIILSKDNNSPRDAISEISQDYKDTTDVEATQTPEEAEPSPNLNSGNGSTLNAPQPIESLFSVPLDKLELGFLDSDNPSKYLVELNLSLEEKQDLIDKLIDKFSSCLSEKTFCGQKPSVRGNGTLYLNRQDSPGHHVLQKALDAIDSYEDQRETNQPFLQLSADRAQKIMKLENPSLQRRAMDSYTSAPSFDDWETADRLVSNLDNSRLAHVAPRYLSEVRNTSNSNTYHKNIVSKLKRLIGDTNDPINSDLVRNQIHSFSETQEEYIENYNLSCHLLSSTLANNEYKRSFKKSFQENGLKKGFQVSPSDLNCQ